MANLGQDIKHPEEGGFLKSWIARDTTRPPVSIYSNLRANLRPTLSNTALPNAGASKLQVDEIYLTHIGGKVGGERWPMPRSKGSQGDLRTITSRVAEPLCCSRSATIPSSPNRHMLPGANFAPKKEVASSNKRKASVPDLGLGTMTTVQEGCLDSPTLPGHHPIFIRSLSVPDTKLRRLSEETSEETPRGSEFPCVDAEKLGARVLIEEGSDTVLGSISSTILQKELTPLLITPNNQPNHTVCANRPKPSDDQEDKPPQVPPKSPRTKSRASPRPRKPPHSATSSVSTIYTTTSAATSTSSLGGRASPKRRPTPPRVSSPFIQHASLDDIQERIPARSVNYGRNGGYNPPLVESPRSQTFTLTEEQQETPVLSRSDHIKFSADRKCDEPADNGIGAKEAGNSKWHQRGASEASVLERGRPMRRGDTSLMQRLSRAKLRGPSLAEENIGIPTGSKPREASTVIPIAELEFLKQQAYEQVESFEVLAAKDVSSLSKELSLLDERCEYLRRTYTSLRQGRKGLHARMISYLKSPRMAKFSCESMLKQEEALAELDLSIEDWVSKLEHAENRRTRIQQKLLEHVAATLTVNITGITQSPRRDGVQTPPMSPENSDDDYHTKRRDVQSIKVYADSGVAALLSAIEKEIGLLDDCSNKS